MTPGQLALRTLLVGGIITFTVITGFAYTTLLERKLLALLQVRIGPNRAGYIAIPRKGKDEIKLLDSFVADNAPNPSCSALYPSAWPLSRPVRTTSRIFNGAG